MYKAALVPVLITAALFSSTAYKADAYERHMRDVVHDTNGHVIRSTSGACVRTEWQSGNGDECGPRRYTVHNARIDEADRTVYFEFNKTRLLDGERHKLDTLAHNLKADKLIRSVSIVGYADRKGSKSYNEVLSKKRAKMVESYLRKQGYLNTSLAKTRWLGESAPVTNCPDNLARNELIKCLQSDRRVTVEIIYQDEWTAKHGY